DECICAHVCDRCRGPVTHPSGVQTGSTGAWATDLGCSRLRRRWPSVDGGFPRLLRRPRPVGSRLAVTRGSQRRRSVSGVGERRATVGGEGTARRGAVGATGGASRLPAALRGGAAAFRPDTGERVVLALIRRSLFGGAPSYALTDDERVVTIDSVRRGP